MVLVDQTPPNRLRQHLHQPVLGNCYTEFDNNAAGNAIRMSRSTNGGLSWSTPIGDSSGSTGLGGQPVVRPNGTVIMPYLSTTTRSVRSARSTVG
jgi:hypothetical protein